MTVKTVAEFIKDADDELERGDWHGAWKIATDGLQYYPEDALLKKYAYVLAPPKVTVVPRDPNRDVQANLDWIKQNRSRYQGQWVGIRNGQLLATGKSFDEVVAQVGRLKNTGILVTPIY